MSENLGNALLGFPLSPENLEHQHFPEIRKGHFIVPVRPVIGHSIIVLQAQEHLKNNKNQNQTDSPGLLSVQQLLPGPQLLFGPFLPKDPEGLENQEALEGPAIPENQEHPTER